MRVLVADDDEEMRRVLVDALTARGHDVRAVADGVALLLELAGPSDYHHGAIDVIVTDIRMPRCSGLGVLQALRAAGVRIPTLLLTAFGAEEIHAEATRLGAWILDKPFPMSRLVDVVEQLSG